MIQQELRPVVCDQRQTDLSRIIVYIVCQTATCWNARDFSTSEQSRYGVIKIVRLGLGTRINDTNHCYRWLDSTWSSGGGLNLAF